MTSSEKKMGGPTSFAASTSTFWRSAPGGAVSRCLCAFSTRTIAASTIAPMAIAMPPRLMMFELMRRKYIGTNASPTATGSERTGTIVLRKWSRKMKMIRLTTSASSSSVWRSVWIARSINPDRS